MLINKTQSGLRWGRDVNSTESVVNAWAHSSRAVTNSAKSQENEEENYIHRESLGSTAGTDTPSGADMVGCFAVEKYFPHSQRLVCHKGQL